MSLRDQHIRISDVLSVILNPSVLTGVFFCFLADKFKSQGASWIVHAAISVIFTSLVPIGLIFFLKARGKLTDVEMSMRPERERVYVLCIAGYATGAILLFLLGATWPLWGFLTLHVPNTFVLLAFNRRLKVSIHTMVLTSVYVGALMFYGMQAVPFGILILIAAWARWDAGNHTMIELLYGVSIGGVLTPMEIFMLKAAFGN